MAVATLTKGRTAGERILATGADLFARFGYNGVSTRDIASAADVNEVTIYRHYPRKHDLYLAVLESELRQVHLRGDLLAEIAEAQEARSAFARAYNLIYNTLMQRPQMLRLIHFGILELNPDFDLLLRKHLGELIEVIAHYLEPWIQKGELLCTDARSAILAMVAIVAGHNTLSRVFLNRSCGPEPLYTAFADLSFPVRDLPPKGRITEFEVVESL